MDESPEAVEAPERRSWPPPMRRAAAIGWSSFLAASLGTMLVFAALDPQLIVDGLGVVGAGDVPFWLTRTGIYTVGFFLLWFVAAAGSALTAFLMGSDSA